MFDLSDIAHESGKHHTNRRAFLRGSAALTVAAATGGLSLAAAGTADAVVDETLHFKLDGTGGNPVLRQTLHQPYWAMQSFAYDHVYGHIYFVQTKVGSDTGDLWVTRTDLSGNVLGAMAIHAFDHGSSIGVEPDTDGSPYIWVAGDWESANPHVTPPVPPNSHKIARFKYKDGGDLDYFNPGGQYLKVFTVDVATFVDCPRPAIDPYNNRLLIRYMGTTTPWRLALFDLSQVVSSGVISKRLLERAIPTNAELGLTDSDLFQGITAYGQYAYLLFGGPPSSSDSTPPSYIICIDMNDPGSAYRWKFSTTAGASLPGREPQGIAVWRSSSGPRLAFGFSDKITSTSPDSFEASVFFKDQLTSAWPS